MVVDILKSLLARPFYVGTFFAGLILLLLSYFRITDTTGFQLSPYSTPIYGLLGVGLFLMLFSVLLCVWMESDLRGWVHPVRIKRTAGGYQVPIGPSRVNVAYGKIEDAEVLGPSNAVVLPANEFFDDECIRDGRSALGAYMLKHFPGQIEDIQRLVKARLEDLPSKTVEKEKGALRQSYGVGTCVFLDAPLSSSHRIILAAVTEKRTGTGLKAEISFIYRVIGEVISVAVDRRLSDIHMPVIGSGHGGLRTEVALFSMVSALSEVLCKPFGHRLNINIVVFRSDTESKPEVSPKALRRVLRVSAGMFRLDPCA
ncbi:MAG TPA: macro domain-containing protein [Terriglobia bacterium]|nr:macro domain-containing protein [Terriglobia bacterium]